MKVHVNLTLRVDKDSVADAVISVINVIDWYGGGKELIKNIDAQEVFEWNTASATETPTAVEKVTE